MNPVMATSARAIGKIAVSPFQAMTVAQMPPSSSPYRWIRRKGTVPCAHCMKRFRLSGTSLTLPEPMGTPTVPVPPSSQSAFQRLGRFSVLLSEVGRRLHGQPRTLICLDGTPVTEEVALDRG